MRQPHGHCSRGGQEALCLPLGGAPQPQVPTQMFHTSDAWVAQSHSETPTCPAGKRGPAPTGHTGGRSGHPNPGLAGGSCLQQHSWWCSGLTWPARLLNPSAHVASACPGLTHSWEARVGKQVSESVWSWDPCLQCLDLASMSTCRPLPTPTHHLKTCTQGQGHTNAQASISCVQPQRG